MKYLEARDLSQQVSQRFVQHFDGQPDAVGRAPGRVNLIGEHTDYNGGLCLPIALPHAAYVAVRRRDDGRIRVVSSQTGSWAGTVSDLKPGAASEGAAYVVGTLWALRAAGVEMSGLDVYVESEVPMGSGLSSSAAVICAAAAAMAHDEFSPQQLVDVTIQAETEGVGAPTGGLDQTVSVLAEAGLALLLDFGSGQDRVAGRVHWHPESDGLGLLVVDTGVRHSHAGGGYGDRRAECEAAAEALGVALLAEATDADALPDPLRRRARHILTEVDRVRRVVAAVEAADWTGVGELFTASHASLRDDFEVSCPELDVVVDTANGSGALGARMTGGGFGGSALVLAPTVELARIGDAITRAFEAEGWSGPTFLHAPASAGASVTH